MTYLVGADLPPGPAGERFRALLAQKGIVRLPGAHNGWRRCRRGRRAFRGAVSVGGRDDGLDGPAGSRRDHRR